MTVTRPDSGLASRVRILADQENCPKKVAVFGEIADDLVPDGAELDEEVASRVFSRENRVLFTTSRSSPLSWITPLPPLI